MVLACTAKISGRDHKESNGVETIENQTKWKTKGKMGGPDPSRCEEDGGSKYEIDG